MTSTVEMQATAISGDEAFREACDRFRLAGGSQYAIARAAASAASRGTPAAQHQLPYASPEARTKACETLGDGQRAVHMHPAKRTQAPAFPPVDEFLFNVGASRERMRLEIEATHAMLPESIVPRRKGQTDERSIAERMTLFLKILDERATLLLRDYPVMDPAGDDR